MIIFTRNPIKRFLFLFILYPQRGNQNWQLVLIEPTLTPDGSLINEKTSLNKKQAVAKPKCRLLKLQRILICFGYFDNIYLNISNQKRMVKLSIDYNFLTFRIVLKNIHFTRE